jgi:hypothetical protein
VDPVLRDLLHPTGTTSANRWREDDRQFGNRRSSRLLVWMPCGGDQIRLPLNRCRGSKVSAASGDSDAELPNLHAFFHLHGANLELSILEVFVADHSDHRCVALSVILSGSALNKINRIAVKP